MNAPNPPEVEIRFTRCSLCNREIEETATDPCFIRVETKTGAWQMWTCHGACFKSVWLNRQSGPKNLRRCTSESIHRKVEGPPFPGGP